MWRIKKLHLAYDLLKLVFYSQLKFELSFSLCFFYLVTGLLQVWRQACGSYWWCLKRLESWFSLKHATKKGQTWSKVGWKHATETPFCRKRSCLLYFFSLYADFFSMFPFSECSLTWTQFLLARRTHQTCKTRFLTNLNDSMFETQVFL